MMAGGGEDHDRAPAAMGAGEGFCDCHQKREFSSVSFSGELVESCSWFDCVDCFAYLFLIRS